MGTRADFYSIKEKNMHWLGSIAWDGHPESIPDEILSATGRRVYEGAVQDFLKERNDATTPDMGWPWPWETSKTTDYSYALVEGKVMGSCFGSPWFDAKNEPENSEYPDGESPDFPEMDTSKFAAGGPRSGLIVITAKQEIDE